MDISRFKIMYSELIESYQYIEMHLKGIYAQLNMGVPITENTLMFYNNLIDVNEDCLNAIIKKVREEKLHNEYVIDRAICDRLEAIRVRRNYWCHSCFTQIVYDRTTGDPKQKYTDELLKDYSEAKEIEEMLFKIKINTGDIK